MHTRFWFGNLIERDHLEDLGLDGKIILKWVFKKWEGKHGLDWTDKALDWKRWRALVNALMKFRDPKMR